MRETSTSKSILRRELMNRRLEMAGALVEERSMAAQKRILEHERWLNAGTVLLYVAFRNETRTDLLLENAWDTGKRVLLPRCLRSDASGCNIKGMMELVPASSQEELASGAYGIPEPADYCLADGRCDIDLAVLPGVAFDRQGFRLGYGGGYYDRLLATGRLDNCLHMGLCYGFQLLPALAPDPWDKPVRAVCTESEFIWI